MATKGSNQGKKSKKAVSDAVLLKELETSNVSKLATKYNVSVATMRNWVNKAKEKLETQSDKKDEEVKEEKIEEEVEEIKKEKKDEEVVEQKEDTEVNEDEKSTETSVETDSEKITEESVVESKEEPVDDEEPTVEPTEELSETKTDDVSEEKLDEVESKEEVEVKEDTEEKSEDTSETKSDETSSDKDDVKYEIEENKETGQRIVKKSSKKDKKKVEETKETKEVEEEKEDKKPIYETIPDSLNERVKADSRRGRYVLLSLVAIIVLITVVAIIAVVNPTGNTGKHVGNTRENREIIREGLTNLQRHQGNYAISNVLNAPDGVSYSFDMVTSNGSYTEYPLDSSGNVGLIDENATTGIKYILNDWITTDNKMYMVTVDDAGAPTQFLRMPDSYIDMVKSRNYMYVDRMVDEFTEISYKDTVNENLGDGKTEQIVFYKCKLPSKVIREILGAATEGIYLSLQKDYKDNESIQTYCKYYLQDLDMNLTFSDAIVTIGLVDGVLRYTNVEVGGLGSRLYSTSAVLFSEMQERTTPDFSTAIDYVDTVQDYADYLNSFGSYDEALNALHAVGMEQNIQNATDNHVTENNTTESNVTENSSSDSSGSLTSATSSTSSASN